MNYKQIKVRRTTWGESYAIVKKLHFKHNSDKYPKAYGYCKFSDGSEKLGKIDNAGTFSWVLIDVLEDDLKLVYDVK